MQSLSHSVDSCPSDITQKITRMSLTDDTDNEGISPFTFCYELDDFCIEQCVSGKNQPELNVPERIIFVIDVMQNPRMSVRDLNCGLLAELKHAVSVFITNKQLINKEHEYAVLAFKNGTCDVVADFQTYHKPIVSQIERINACDFVDEDICPLDPVFEAVYNLLRLKHNHNKKPTRVIFLYTRCFTKIGFYNEHYFLKLLKDENFFFDVVFIYLKSHEDTMFHVLSKNIEGLKKLTKIGKLEISNCQSSKELHEKVMKLLAHPYQRSKKRDKNGYSISDQFKITYFSQL